jgi:hypothetical protein
LVINFRPFPRTASKDEWEIQVDDQFNLSNIETGIEGEPLESPFFKPTPVHTQNLPVTRMNSEDSHKSSKSSKSSKSKKSKESKISGTATLKFPFSNQKTVDSDDSYPPHGKGSITPTKSPMGTQHGANITPLKIPEFGQPEIPSVDRLRFETMPVNPLPEGFSQQKPEPSSRGRSQTISQSPQKKESLLWPLDIKDDLHAADRNKVKEKLDHGEILVWSKEVTKLNKKRDQQKRYFGVSTKNLIHLGKEPYMMGTLGGIEVESTWDLLKIPEVSYSVKGDDMVLHIDDKDEKDIYLRTTERVNF